MTLKHKTTLPSFDAMSISTLLESTDGPATSPTPRPTWATEHGKNYCDAARSMHGMNVAALFVVFVVFLFIC
jgi:hypothetical protein